MSSFVNPLNRQVEISKVVDGLARSEFLQRDQTGNGWRFGAAAYEQPVASEREGERVLGQRLRSDVSRREAGRRMHAFNHKRIGAAGPDENRAKALRAVRG